MSLVIEEQETTLEVSRPTYLTVVANSQTSVLEIATSALTINERTVTFLSPNAIDFTAPLSRNGDTISIPAADTDTDGYLTSDDWNTFNGKQPAGNYVTTARTVNGHALSSDVTVTPADLGLVIGTDVQAQDAELSALAGLTSAADKVPYFTGSGTAAVTTLTSAGRALIDDASASAQRTTLGLGTAATTAASDYATAAQGTKADNAGAVNGIIKSNGSASFSAVTDNSTNWNTAYTDRLKWDGGSTGLTASTGRTSLGATTVGANIFTLTNPSAISFVKIAADNTVSARTPSQVRTDLSLVIGTDVQAYDADLTTWAGLTPSANAQSLVTAADYSAMRTLLGLVIGTNVQAYDADLTTWAGITPATGIGTFLGTPTLANLKTAITDETAVGWNLLTLTDPSAITFLRINADNTVTARTASQLKTDLSLTVGTDVQAYDADLASWAAITRASGFDTFATTPSMANLKSLLTDETAVGWNLLTLANPGAITFLQLNADNTVTAQSASSQRTALGLAIGTNVQAWDADLDSWAAITRASGFDTFVGTPSSANLKALLTDELGDASGKVIFALGTLAIASGKTLTANNTITLSGTDGTTMTFPTTSATLARTDAANTFTGHQTIEGVTSTGATGTGKFVFDTAPTIAGGSITGLTALAIRDTSAAFDVTIAGTSSTTLTAGRTLTLDVTNAARTVKLTGSPTLADWFDQSVKTTAAPTFAGLTSTATINGIAVGAATGATIDITGGTVLTIANNASSVLTGAAIGGLILVHAVTVTGDLAMFLAAGGGGTPVLVSQTGSSFTNVQNNAGTVNLWNNAGALTLQNKQGSSINFYVAAIKTR